MTRSELNEATAVLGVTVKALYRQITGRSGFSTQQVLARQALGQLSATAATLVQSATLGATLFNCFELVRQCGATRVQMDGVRVAMLGQSPKTLPGVAVAVASIYFSLIEQSRMVSATTFVSREDVDAMLDTMNTIFDPAEAFAADATDDPQVYQTLLALHSAITSDLVARARPLPQIVNFRFSQRMPSLVLANRIYSDATRADELRKENKVIHPAFSPGHGRCLSF